MELTPGAQKTVTVALDIALEASVRVEPDIEAPVSSEAVVYWTGPDRKGDYVTIVSVGAAQNAYSGYQYTARGNPVKLRVPSEAGDYEVRYVLGRPARVLAAAPLKAVAVEATLEAAESVSAGDSFDVAWTGPAYKDDWITIVKPDAAERSYLNYQYTKKASPIALTAPLEAGDYELRYVQAGQKIIARRPIVVTGAAASLAGPETARAGSTQTVTWTGPDTKGDWITIVAPAASERSYKSYAYTAKGEALDLQMPLEAGEYELRYVQRGQKIIARRPISVTAATASLDAPETAKAGEPVAIAWEGPGEQGDWITVVDPDEAENRYTDYAYTKKNPVEIRMPAEPGVYELRYTLKGQKAIARKPIAIEDVDVSLNAPESAKAGGDVRVEWQGPGFPRDFVTIVKADAAENRYSRYKYTRDGSPAVIKAPSEPGDYELRYVLGGERVVARQPFTVLSAD